MSLSMIDAQRTTILKTIHHITRDDWKVLVVDPGSKKILDNAVEEDAILNENITNIEQITERRSTNRDVEALYFLTPQALSVDCVMADFQKRKYKKAHLVWTSLLPPALREKIDKSQSAREQIAQLTVLNVEYYPRESHLVTFRDPYSFPIFYHPGCNRLVRQHMEDIAQRIVGVCVALGEYPTIRYFRRRDATHEASVLCSHLARFVQDELDLYAKFHDDFPAATSRPRGTLYITDRSMDLFAPILHEFTYQAMVHDLLPIKEGLKITYRTTINEGAKNQETKDIPITEKDKLWRDNRHRHMKDVIDKLMADFHRFIKDNPNFTGDGGSNSLSAIKDMMAGLPQFQETKEAYALHLGMAQESMSRFQKGKLNDLSSVEQICATGLDEDYKKPKGLADQVVRMLDEDNIALADRFRLLLSFLLYKDGMLPADVEKLLAHAKLPPSDAQTISNLEHLGARTARKLKDPRPIPPPLFPRKPPPPPTEDDLLLSRYEPVLQSVLEAHASSTLDTETFPYTKPPLDMHDGAPAPPATTSLRSAKPTWAKSRAGNVSAETRQRVIVFVAGGATYSESRVCYDVGRQTGRDVVLVSSHMLTPPLFLRQVADLSADRRRLGIPAEQPQPAAPAHLFEPDEAPRPPPSCSGPPQGQAGRSQSQQQPPTQAMGAMRLDGRPNGGQPAGGSAGVQANSSAKLQQGEKDGKEKKRRFGFGRKDKG